jgi:hypothetical protein
MLKKLLVGVVIVFVVIIASAIVLPIVFKDDIIALVQKEANNNINATLEFGDIGLSLFESFPDFTLTIEDIKVTGVDQFVGVKLADIEALKLSLDLMSVINGGKIQINTIGLVTPKFHVIVLKDGTANYDIAKATEEGEEEISEELEEEGVDSDGGFSIGLSEYYIRNANIIYDDRAGGMYAHLVNFTHEGSGDFTQDDFLLETMTDADAIDFKMDGVTYLSRTALDMKFDMNMNLSNMKFDFVENYVKLNALHLGFDGSMAMPAEEGDPIDFDLTFETKETTFKSLLSMVPAIFMTDFEDIETDGNLALSGMAKGRMVGDQLPAFALDLTVSEARFKYPDLPKAAENISIDLHVKNPGGSDDNTIVDLNKFHVELANNPIDMVLHMRTPISDPYIDVDIDMNMDLSSLAEVIPLEEGQAITGQVISDIQLKGNQSALDEERYQDFEAGGSLVLKNLDYKDPTMAYQTLIKSCSLQFTPASAKLNEFDMMVGKSDISLTGHVDNIVEWYVADKPLIGAFDMSSKFMDINEFMGEEEASESSSNEAEAEEASGGVAEIPAGFDFELDVAITELIYDNLNITNVYGEVLMRDQALDMTNLSMNMLEGGLNMSGSYSTLNPVAPDFDLNLLISRWDIPSVYKYLDLAKKLAPVMENATGAFSSKLTMAGKLDQNMEPMLNTLDGKGKLTTHKVSLKNPPVLAKAADAVKYDGLKNMELDNVNVSFKFEDGRVAVEPVDYTIGKEIPSKFSGSHGFDGTLDYVWALDIPTKLMGGQATQIVSGLLSKASAATGVNAQMPERVKIDLDITGTSEDPKVTPRMKGTEDGSAADDLKGQAMDELNKKKDELENKARDEAEKAKAEAEAKARAEADKAKKNAEATAKKAADDAKAKADAEKKKAEAAAKKKAEEEKKKAEEAAKKKAADAAKYRLKKLGK